VSRGTELHDLAADLRQSHERGIERVDGVTAAGHNQISAMIDIALDRLGHIIRVVREIGKPKHIAAIPINLAIDRRPKPLGDVALEPFGRDHADLERFERLHLYNGRGRRDPLRLDEHRFLDGDGGDLGSGKHFAR
jgi:hypothetical protein